VGTSKKCRSPTSFFSNSDITIYLHYEVSRDVEREQQGHETRRFFKKFDFR